MFNFNSQGNKFWFKNANFHWVFRLIYLFINILFIYKYGVRQTLISIYLLIVAYILLFALLFYFDIFNFKIFKRLGLKHFYLGVTIAASLLILFIVVYTNGNLLQVDRWSAMHTAIKALMHGEYPYTAVDHLNGRTSNFPGLLILGIPFYLLGNVGYLQVFALLLLAYSLSKFLPIDKAFKYLLLILLSPAYWWEIFAISDLFSNMIILICFIILLEKKTEGQPFCFPIFLGFAAGFLTMTRGIAVIPLTLYLFKDFWNITLRKKTKFLISAFGTIVLLITVVLLNCPDLNTLKLYNPLLLQTNYLPHYVHLIVLILPFLAAFKIMDFKKDFFRYSTILILIPVSISFIYRCFLYGFNLNFDLSYFSMVIPFVLFEIVKKNKLVTAAN